MDDQQTYLLNGLLTRQFSVGRIVRFRKLSRGRQAGTYEILTGEQHEYLVQLYPPAFSGEQLEFVARAVNALDANRFSVLPMLAMREGNFVAEGVQGGHMMLSEGAAGSALLPAEYTAHDISQVGLRMAWMHRLLREQVAAPAGAGATLKERLAEMFAHPTAESARLLPAMPEGMRAMLLSLLDIPTTVERGWVHGELQASALLHDSDHQLRTVVDWGLLHFGLPLEDVVDAFVSLCVTAEGTYEPERSRMLRESYESLVELKGVAWTPVVGAWCAQRLLDAGRGLRPLPKGFGMIVGAPEKLAVALATCG